MNIDAILMMPAKLVSLDLEIKIFGDKGYAIIIFVYDVTNKIYDVTQHFFRRGHVTKVWSMWYFYEEVMITSIL